jgi:hypothetical protein
VVEQAGDEETTSGDGEIGDERRSEAGIDAEGSLQGAAPTRLRIDRRQRAVEAAADIHRGARDGERAHTAAGQARPPPEERARLSLERENVARVLAERFWLAGGEADIESGRGHCECIDVVRAWEPPTLIDAPIGSDMGQTVEWDAADVVEAATDVPATGPVGRDRPNVTAAHFGPARLALTVRAANDDTRAGRDADAREASAQVDGVADTRDRRDRVVRDPGAKRRDARKRRVHRSAAEGGADESKASDDSGEGAPSL